MQSVVPSYRQLFEFKKQFASDVGASALLGCLFSIKDRNLENLFISLENGKIYHKHFFPNYNESHLLCQADPVPFRLSRNMNEFLEPLGSFGPFAASFRSISDAFYLNIELVRELLRLFLRDDIIRSEALSSSTFLETSIGKNCEQITRMVEQHSPSNLGIGARICENFDELIRSANSNDGIARLPPSWHPWF